MTDLSDLLKLPKSENEFSLMIEGLKTDGATYMETIVKFCEESLCDIEDVARLINPSLRDKLEVEGKQAKMFKDNEIHVLPL